MAGLGAGCVSSVWLSQTEGRLFSRPGGGGGAAGPVSGAGGGGRSSGRRYRNAAPPPRRDTGTGVVQQRCDAPASNALLCAYAGSAGLNRDYLAPFCVELIEILWKATSWSKGLTVCILQG